MKFSEYKYERPNLDFFKSKMDEQLVKIATGKDSKAADRWSSL